MPDDFGWICDLRVAHRSFLQSFGNSRWGFAWTGDPGMLRISTVIDRLPGRSFNPLKKRPTLLEGDAHSLRLIWWKQRFRYFSSLLSMKKSTNTVIHDLLCPVFENILMTYILFPSLTWNIPLCPESDFCKIVFHFYFIPTYFCTIFSKIFSISLFSYEQRTIWTTNFVWKPRNFYVFGRT